MKYALAIIVLVVAALLAWLLLRPAGMPAFSLPLPGLSAPAGAPADGAGFPAATDAGNAYPPPEPDLPADIELDPAAIASLRGAREFGDPRTPPIGRSEPQEQASPEELADPAKYAEFEARQERKLKRAYVIEAERYVRQLKEDVERGRAMGIPADEIARVEKKILGIENMRKELLAQDPGLLDAPAAR